MLRAGSQNETKALCDTGSLQTRSYQEFVEKLDLDGAEMTVRVAGIDDKSANQSKKVEVTIGPADSTPLMSVLYWSTFTRIWKKEKYKKPLKRKYGYLSCIRQNTISLSEVRVKLGQDTSYMICPLASKNGSASTPWAVKLPLA